MQVRIRDLYRADPETVQRVAHDFAAMGIDHFVISDSVPVSVTALVNNRIFLRLRSGQALKREAPIKTGKTGIF